jgi:hypothetical protein
VISARVRNCSRLWTGRSANWQTTSLQCPRSAYHNGSGSSSNKAISDRRIVRRLPGTSKKDATGDGEILRTFPKLPLDQTGFLTMRLEDEVTGRLNVIRTQYSPPERNKTWRRTNPTVFPELPISQLDLYYETFNRICDERNSFRLGRGQFGFYLNKNNPKPGLLVLHVPVPIQLRSIYDEALASFRGKVVIKELAVSYSKFRTIIPVHDQISSIEAQKILVTLNREFPSGFDLGLVQGFNLYRVSYESFTGEHPKSLSTGPQQRALVAKYRFQDVEGED